MPPEVIKISLEILSNLEKGELDDEGMPKISLPKSASQPAQKSGQMSLFMHPAEHLLEELRSIDISAMTPLDALNRLSRLKEEC